MSDRKDLLNSVAKTIETYRFGEVTKPTAEHVDKWLSQFTPVNQIGFLREFDHVMKQSYITEEDIETFLSNQLTNENLTGRDHRAYWSNVNFLRIQKDGQSQKSMLSLLDLSLKEKFGLQVKSCGSPDGDFLYIDDIIFSGGRVRTDLEDWIINNAPKKAKVRVLVIAYHRLGQWQLKTRLENIAKESGKDIDITYWRLFEVENRLRYRDDAQVLWPVEAPDIDVVTDYITQEQKFPFTARTPGGPLGLFSSEAGRQLLEREFLIAGAKIRAQGQISHVNRPLGHGYFGLGFGSTLVTYRNCPNNCPLAMWWGDPTATSGALKWYPLLPRKNYSSAENVFGKLFDL